MLQEGATPLHAACEAGHERICELLLTCTTTAIQARAEMIRMDVNGDGMVDLEEFTAAGGTERQFNRLDANSDGVLNVQELTLQKGADVNVRRKVYYTHCMMCC